MRPRRASHGGRLNGRNLADLLTGGTSAAAWCDGRPPPACTGRAGGRSPSSAAATFPTGRTSRPLCRRHQELLPRARLRPPLPLRRLHWGRPPREPPAAQADSQAQSTRWARPLMKLALLSFPTDTSATAGSAIGVAQSLLSHGIARTLIDSHCHRLTGWRRRGFFGAAFRHSLGRCGCGRGGLQPGRVAGFGRGGGGIHMAASGHHLSPTGPVPAFRCLTESVRVDHMHHPHGNQRVPPSAGPPACPPEADPS